MKTTFKFLFLFSFILIANFSYGQGKEAQLRNTDEKGRPSIQNELPKDIDVIEYKKIEFENGYRVTFRWTPLVPKPQQPVTYRLKVWQLMQGQNSTQAMRTNKPIVTKDVDNITSYKSTEIYTGPCKPPYLCDFVWNVEALNADGKSLAKSEPTTFSVQ
jgi:hypothetical protein